MLAPTQFQPKTLAQSEPTQADQDRKQQMREAWKAYRGDFQKPLKIRKDQPDDNVISNRCAPVVDKGVSFLFGQVLKIEASDETAEASTEIQDFLDSFWGDDDDKMTLLSQLGINGGVCGEPFVKLIPAQQGEQYPRLVVMDPQLIRVVTAPDDCSCILAYIIEYPGTGDVQKRQIISRVDLNGVVNEYDSPELNATWTIANYFKRGSMTSWQLVGTIEAWPWPFAPIFCNQNLPNPNELWGIPDLTPDLINQNKVLNFIQSNTSRIIKFHAHPKTWGKGFRAAQISVAVDETFVIEAPDGELHNLEMTSDLSSSLSFASTIRADMDEQSRVPAVALGRQAELPKGNISGVALALLFQPLLEKTTLKQRLYGRLIRDVSRAALVVAGLLDVSEYQDYAIELHWAPLLPIDNVAAAQEALLLKQLGVSDDTLLRGLGYNPEEELEKSTNEDAQKMLAYSRGQGFPVAPPIPPGQAQQPQQQQQGESPFMGREQ